MFNVIGSAFPILIQKASEQWLFAIELKERGNVEEVAHNRLWFQV
jgi:hypothetical protein